MKHERSFLLPRASEFGVLVGVQCGDCRGLGSVETPRGSGRFDTCEPCGGLGEVVIYEGEDVATAAVH